MRWDKEERSLENRGYIVRGILGRGAFSKVYSVEERGTERRAACKISENTKLLKREEEILKKLKHPLFPGYYTSWQEGEVGFLLMEEVSGENLAELIRQGGKLSVYQIAELGLELAEGLLYLHESRPAVLFRDVKPENIMLRKDGSVKLLDFGCACKQDTDDRTRAGTPGFSAPEQFMEGGKQTCLCDVYGLGRTLQELLWAGTCQGRTGQLLEGQGERRRRCEGQGERRRLCEGHGERRRLWERLCERRDIRQMEKLLAACVEKEPSARPADMRVVMEALFHLCTPALGGRRHGKRFGNRHGSGSSDWRGGWYGKQGSDLWQKGIICEKNIRKSDWKIS